MTIEILMLKTPGCKSCASSRNAIEAVMDDYDIDFEEIDLTEEPEYAQEYQVMAAPGIVINGEKAFQGGISEKQLRNKLDTITG